MDYSKSFIYVISSDERTNLDIASTYDFSFGGFSEPFDDYFCEVISFASVGGITVNNSYYLFVAENLASDGYFCSKKLSSRESILAILPLSAVQDSYIQSDGGSISFQIINARAKKTVRFKFVKQDFSTPVNATDVNNAAETKWVLVLKLSSIE